MVETPPSYGPEEQVVAEVLALDARATDAGLVLGAGSAEPEPKIAGHTGAGLPRRKPRANLP